MKPTSSAVLNLEGGSIQCLQDALFFGLEYTKTLFQELEMHAYFSDGDLIFEGQTVLFMDGAKAFEKENVLSLLSYLSGAFTLLSCFTHKEFDFSIASAPTKNFIYSEGEKQAILKAGAFVKPISDIKDSDFLDGFKMKKQEVKKLLNKEPSKTYGIYGPFLPEDLEEFREFENIDFVYPACLQGSFPYSNMGFTA